jgi:hypothetical protein
VDGTNVGSVTDTRNYISSIWTIGSFGPTPTTTTSQYHGYISNFRVVNGEALYTSNFTPPTSPLTKIANTSLLICQSNRFIDNSDNDYSITLNGDVSVQPYSPFAPTEKYSTANVGGSGYFDGNGDFLSVPYSEELSLTSVSNFTIECWIYLTATPPDNTSIIRNRPSSGGTGYDLRIDTSRNIMFYYTTGSQITTTESIPLNQWTHVVFVRNASTGSIYLNGVLNVTGSFSNGSTSAGPNIIGRSQLNDDLTGYISNLRVLSGTSLYTSNFTPPSAPLTNIANTSLLCNFTNAGIFDSTAKNVLETVGDAKVSTAQYKYGTGSMYFDGTGDYLVSKNNNNFDFGTGDFTVEFWINVSASGTYTQVVGTLISDTASGTWRVGNRFNSTNVLYFARGNGSGFDEFTAASNVNDGSWHHVAVARQSGNVRIFVDGTLSNTATISGTCTSGNNLRIGYNQRDNTYITGYIDDLRITKGYARYTSNFTPPAAALKDR